MTNYIAPTTDCPTCGRTAKDCDDSHAKGWDGCCLKCDERGRTTTHRLHTVEVGPLEAGPCDV